MRRRVQRLIRMPDVDPSAPNPIILNWSSKEPLDKSVAQCPPESGGEKPQAWTSSDVESRSAASNKLCSEGDVMTYSEVP
jgi:hypothetical protein